MQRVQTVDYLAAGALAVCLALALFLAVRSFLQERADFVRTAPAAISRRPDATGIADLREITMAAQGCSIAGWYAPSRNRAAVVLVHGTGADRSSMLLETGFLAKAGFGVLALDLPGQGASAGRTRWGATERLAVSAAVDWLSARDEVDASRLGGLGSSMGAYVLTQAAVLDRRLAAVTLLCSPSDVARHNWLASSSWGLLTQVPCYIAMRAYGQSLDLTPRDVIGAIAPRPVFIVGGELDEVVPACMTQQLFAAAGEPKELWLVPDARHTDLARVGGPHYRARLIDFYRRTLLQR